MSIAIVDNTKLTTSESKPCCATVKVKECFHCGTTLGAYNNLTKIINGESRSFCCEGCVSAAEFIASEGFADFYRDRELSSLGAGPAKNSDLVFDINDWDIRCDGSECSANIELQGVYCGSCTELISRALGASNIVVEPQFSGGGKYLLLNWIGEATQLEQLLQIVNKLGYRTLSLHSPDRANLHFQSKQKQFLKWIIVAGLGTMQVMTYAVAHYLGAAEDVEIAKFLELMSMVVAAVVVLYSGRMFFENALRDLRHRHLGMDVPIALAIGSAFFMSAYQTLFVSGGGHVYYDSAVMFVFFLLIGRFIEQKVRLQLIDSEEALVRSLPELIDIKRGSVQHLSIKPTQLLQGDQLTLVADSVAPCDVQVLTGHAEIDESSLTGEAKPRSVTVGDQLKAGSKLCQGALEVICSRPWKRSSIAVLQGLIQEGQTTKHSDRFSDWANRYFLSFVMVAIVIVACLWMVIDQSRVFEVVLAMLIATCPCAFALAGPIGNVAASNRMRKDGLLLANPDALKALTLATNWWFDKTGTLTEGNPTIASIRVSRGLQEENCLDIVAAIEKYSQHPLANAFSGRMTCLVAEEFEEFHGKGAKAFVDGCLYFIGSREWIKELQRNGDIAGNFESDAILDLSDTDESGTMYVCLANNNELLAIVGLIDAPRANLGSFFNGLREQGCKTGICSGDNQRNVSDIASKLAVDEVYFSCSPETKKRLLDDARLRGEVSVMVGDGANDAPVLACADVAIAMANGSQLSQAQADIVVLNSDLNALSALTRVAVKTQRIVKQNMVWAIVYNVSILPLAALGFLNPWIAALGMSMSSLIVVLNACRITRG